MSGSGKLSQGVIEADVMRNPFQPRAARAARLGVTESAVRSAIAALVARGEVRMVGTGKGAFLTRGKGDTKPADGRASTRLGALQRAAMKLPGGDITDTRRASLLAAVSGLANWPKAQTTLEREGFVADAVMLHLPESGTTFGPAGAARILAGALVLPAELVEAVVWSAGSRELAAGVLRSALALVADPAEVAP